ncbi:MAG: hypothetical protein ABGX25_03830, partial [Nautiliaceae bacterium]
MKKTILLGAVILTLNAGEITKLFNAIEKIPQTKLDKVLVKEVKANKSQIEYSLYPKISLFA